MTGRRGGARLVGHEVRPGRQTTPPRRPVFLAGTDWDAVAASLDARGYATTGPLLDAAQCRALAGLYAREDGFRSRVVMQRACLRPR